MSNDLRIVTPFHDRLGYLYLEHATIEQDDYSIVISSQNDEIEAMTPLPICALALLMLGPGTNITHAAVKLLAKNNCLIAWVGEEGVRMYAFGTGGTHSSARLIRQAELVSNPETRLQIVRKLYGMRFPEATDPNITIEQLRGKEGIRVRNAYEKLAENYGIKWEGRNIEIGTWPDNAANRALSAGNACLYGICHAAVLSMGFSPALGFIHTGTQLSFVYDLADLYKLDLVLPIAFSIAAEGEEQIERRVRLALRDRFRETKFLNRLADDIMAIFGTDEEIQIDSKNQILEENITPGE